MAEGNAGIFDYAAIKRELNSRGYRPIYRVAEDERLALPQCAPDGTSCLTPCDMTENCRLTRLKHLQS
jgi:hypothetical protein